MAFRSDDPVELAVYELDRTIVFYRDAKTTDSSNHFLEVLPPGGSEGLAVVMWTVDTFDESKSRNVNVLPSPRIIEGH